MAALKFLAYARPVGLFTANVEEPQPWMFQLVDASGDPLDIATEGAMQGLISAINDASVNKGPQTPANSLSVIGTETLFDLTLSLDTNAYQSGDVLFATQEVASVFGANGAGRILNSITVIDEDDQKAAIDFVFLDSNQSLGTENSAPDIDDTEADAILAVYHSSLAASDYVDLGGVSVATKANLNIPLKAASGTTSLWIAGITRGTPTHTASGVRLKLGFL